MSLKEKYEKEITKDLAEELSVDNAHALPKLMKITVNMGTRDSLKDKDTKEALVNHLGSITGQKPKIQPAKKSIAGFGIREGNPVGLTITLRGTRMYDFLEKLITIVFPRVRDFRGISRKSFDKEGNYSLGFSDYSVFPEIDITKAIRNQGVQITMVTNAKNRQESELLLEKLGMPFEKEEN